MTHLDVYENQYDLTKLYTVPYEALFDIQEAAKNTMRSTRREAFRSYLPEAYHSFQYAKKIVDDIEKEFVVRRKLNLEPKVPQKSEQQFHKRKYTKRVRVCHY